MTGAFSFDSRSQESNDDIGEETIVIAIFSFLQIAFVQYHIIWYICKSSYFLVAQILFSSNIQSSLKCKKAFSNMCLGFFQYKCKYMFIMIQNFVIGLIVLEWLALGSSLNALSSVTFFGHIFCRWIKSNRPFIN